jgi:hypothetical protein
MVVFPRLEMRHHQIPLLPLLDSNLVINSILTLIAQVPSSMLFDLPRHITDKLFITSEGSVVTVQPSPATVVNTFNISRIILWSLWLWFHALKVNRQRG